MQFYGFQKLTLLDYPGHTAATVFTGGCNLRCPFCHNALLVTDVQELETYDEDVILTYLKKRQGILDGVAITGGEPLLHKGLRDFIERVRALGMQVKLDTNGFYPKYLKELVGAGLIDYVAVDIKNTKEKYGETVGVPKIDLSPLEETVSYLLTNAVPFEFRTTVVEELHSAADLGKIGQWIAGSERYFLQCFVDSGHTIAPGLTAPSRDKIKEMKAAAEPFVRSVGVRGVEL